MRFRLLSAVSIAALSALILTGCSGATDSEPTATATSTADLCGVAVPTGETAEAISVEGDVGSVPTVSFDTPLDITSAERVVSVTGDGDEITDGSYVSYALAIFSAETGELQLSEGFDGELGQPAQITLGSGADQFFGCATEGSRIVMTVPDAGSGAQVYVIDVLDVIAADAWCAVSEPSGAFPTVAFDADGNPTVTIPDADPPAGVEIEVLEKGDGDVVQSGDTVTVNYEGVKWSDGSVFDSSYDRGATADFPTTGVVTGFQRALEGQTVGTQLIVSMAPECGYGQEGSSANELAGETLVFVVDIIGTASADQ